MNKLEDYSDDINKCSKCGLCQSVCPVYKETGNDCAVSRGKFVMLDGVIKGDLELNNNINKYLDLCLKCDKCSKFCPSGIDVCKIFEAAKYQYASKTILGRLIFFVESKWVFGLIINFFKIITSPFRKNSLHNKNKNKNKTIKVLYFKGCVNNICPRSDIYLNKIFENSDIEIIQKDFDCCGLPFLSSGNLERFEEVKNHNIKMLDCDFDYILTDCASCESTLKKYIDAKFINIGELLLKSQIKFKFPHNTKVTFHKPCHLENDDFLIPLFDNCENVEYIKMDDYDSCCGFGGEFSIKNIRLSKSISKNKAKNILKTNTDYVLTSCPGCVIGLKMGLIGHRKAPKVISLLDFFAKCINE